MNIKDIARIAGVGVSTVSRVINEHPDVNDETRKKILQVIKDYNYIPNQSARLLKRTHMKNIGVIVKGVFNPFFSEMVKVIAEAIEASQYSMILQHDDKDQEDIDSLITFVKEHRLEGVIYLGGNFEDVEEERFESLECKVVLLCSNIKKNNTSPYFSSIGIDDYASAKMAMEYILKQNHKEIALVMGEKKDVGVGRERLKGYQEAMREYGIDTEGVPILEGHYHYKNAYEAVKICLAHNPQLTAFCCAADTMAVGTAKAIIESGKEVGKEIAIIGFDGMDIATYYNPTITTIKQPRAAIAMEGIELLLKILKNKTGHQHTILATEFVKGQSS